VGMDKFNDFCGIGAFPDILYTIQFMYPSAWSGAERQSYVNNDSACILVCGRTNMKSECSNSSDL
jgi:hypothetical protein